MKRDRTDLTPTPVHVAVAAIALSALPLAETGCGSNKLSPNPVPTTQASGDLPRWYPEGAWSAKGGSSRIFIEGKIVFDNDSPRIRPESHKVLDQVIAFMAAHPEVSRVRVEGHTDSNASDEYNLELSAKRSLAVAEYLVKKDVDHTRLVAVGFGKKKPIAPNERADGRAENRRTEFHVAEVNGRPFGGSDPFHGGFPLTVKSKAEMEEEARLAKMPKVAPKPPPFKPTGDEVKSVEHKATAAPPDDDDKPPILSPNPKKKGS
jgi:OmpA-OmpF porin, OOP family